MKNSQKKQIDKTSIIEEFEELKNQPKTTQEEKAVKKEPQKQKSSIEEYYDPSLKPKSTIYYEEKGAKISDVKITTLDGKKVNVLVHGREYIYSYKVDIDNNKIDCLEFGSMIKTKDGVGIAGAVFPEVNKFLPIKSNSLIYRITFECLFNSGEYFFNAGIRDKYGYVYRIVDAYSMKVLCENKSITANIKFFKDLKIEENKV